MKVGHVVNQSKTPSPTSLPAPPASIPILPCPWRQTSNDSPSAAAPAASGPTQAPYEWVEDARVLHEQLDRRSLMSYESTQVLTGPELPRQNTVRLPPYEEVRGHIVCSFRLLLTHSCSLPESRTRQTKSRTMLRSDLLPQLSPIFRLHPHALRGRVLLKGRCSTTHSEGIHLQHRLFSQVTSICDFLRPLRTTRQLVREEISSSILGSPLSWIIADLA